MSGPCTDCGGPDYQTLEARIADLEAENEEWIGYFDASYTDMCHYKDRAEQAEAALAERDRMLRLLISEHVHGVERSPDGFDSCDCCQSVLADLRARAEQGSGT